MAASVSVAHAAAAAQQPHQHVAVSAGWTEGGAGCSPQRMSCMYPSAPASSTAVLCGLTTWVDIFSNVVLLGTAADHNNDRGPLAHCRFREAGHLQLQPVCVRTAKMANRMGLPFVSLHTFHSCPQHATRCSQHVPNMSCAACVHVRLGWSPTHQPANLILSTLCTAVLCIAAAAQCGMLAVGGRACF